MKELKGYVLVAPIVDKVNDELETVGLRGRDHSVQPLQAISSRVDRRVGRRQMLVPYGSRGWDGGHIVETPDADDLQVSCGHVREHLVNILIFRQETAPVAIRPSIVLGHAVNVEEQAIRLGEGSSGSSSRCWSGRRLRRGARRLGRRRRVRHTRTA